MTINSKKYINILSQIFIVCNLRSNFDEVEYLNED